MITESVTFGVATQSIPLRLIGARPSSAQFEAVLDSSNDGAGVEFSGAATVDSFDVALSASTGLDREFISCTTTGAVVGRRYLLGSEWVEVVRIEATGLRVRSPIIGSYTTADRVQSTYVFAAVPTIWSADITHLSDTLSPLPDYRIKWTVTTAGAVLVVHSFFDLLRAPTGPGITLDDLAARMPGLRDKLPADYLQDQARSLIDSAWRSVQADLAASSISSHAVHNAQILAELAILKCRCVLAEGGWRPLGMDQQLFYETSRDAYARFFEMHFKLTSKHALSGNVSAEAGRRVVVPLAVR